MLADADDVTTHHRRLTSGKTLRVVTVATAIAIAIDSTRRRATLSSQSRRETRAHNAHSSIDLHARGDSTRARRGASRAVVVDACVSREVHRDDETDDDSITDRVERGLDRDERDVGGGEVGDDARGV